MKADCAAEFERIYGQDGQWAELFRRSSEYLGTELVRDVGRSGKYLTIDRWTSREAFQRFKQQYGMEYAELDKTCRRLTSPRPWWGSANRLSRPSRSANEPTWDSSTRASQN